MKNGLLVDIGNSTACLAYYDGRKIVEPETMPTEQLLGVLSLKKEIQMAVISSVVPKLDPSVIESLKANGCNTIRFVDHQNIPDLSFNFKHVEQIGADRLVTACAAYRKIKGSCLVIDSGTAVTFCYVDKEGVYQGGAIVPGLGIASKALNDYTAKIPLIYVKPTEVLWGKDTKEAVQVGLFHGYRALIEGMIQSYREKDPEIKVVGTGKGLSCYQGVVSLDAYCPTLILDGLARCYDVFSA